MSLQVTELLFILMVSWYAGRFFRRRLDMPPMLGELIAGLLFGPTVLGWIESSEFIDFLAELGIFFLMFYAGLETDPKLFFKNIKPSILVGILGFAIPLGLGYYGTLWFMPGATSIQALFVGLGLSITAIAVNARILMDLSLCNSRIGNILIGSAVVDDVLSLGFFSAVVKTVEVGYFSYNTFLFSLAYVLAFFAITYFIGKIVLPYVNKYYLEGGGHGFTFALLTAFLFALIGEALGLHVIIGAFFAGLFVREEIKRQDVLDALNDRLMTISYGFLGPIFFVSLSFHVVLGLILEYIEFLTIVLIIAFIGKFAGSYAGGWLAGLKREENAVVAMGMNGRGAVELILVGVGINLGVLNKEISSILVSMAFITTFLTPIGFKFLLERFNLDSCMINPDQEKDTPTREGINQG
ncbi:MAG: hypothetical protein GF416_00250 [Candidatus Altiarchaeales archaeon]|nr:hypothetical protein [Candidatus Altiarchaeales archaeon]MBD3415552.1 hypothetical protein [Candidatus Altiarchaeales archaeon]